MTADADLIRGQACINLCAVFKYFTPPQDQQQPIFGHFDHQIYWKITGETQEVRSDKRKPREKKERKREKKREKRKKMREKERRKEKKETANSEKERQREKKGEKERKGCSG